MIGVASGKIGPAFGTVTQKHTASEIINVARIRGQHIDWRQAQETATYLNETHGAADEYRRYQRIACALHKVAR